MKSRPELAVEVLDRFDGFNISKGRSQSLEYVRIRMKSDTVRVIAEGVSSRVVR